MDFTEHFQLLKLGQGDNLSANGYQFTGSDRERIDDILFLATSGHHHDGTVIGGATAPTVNPNPTESATDGALPAGETLYYETTVVHNGIESQPSPVGSVTISDALGTPTVPTAARLVSGGILEPGTYWYAVTAYRTSSTLETLPSPSAIANLPSSAGNNQVVRLTLPDLPSTADGLNLYRRIPGSTSYNFLVSIPAPSPGDTYDDTGSVVADCERLLPFSDTSGASHSVQVTRPDTWVGGDTWRVYRTFVSSDWTNTLLVTGLTATTYTDLGATPSIGAPPDADVTIVNPDPVNLDTETQGFLPASKLDVHAHLLTFFEAGAATLGQLGNEWMSMFNTCMIDSSILYLGAGATPAVTDLIVTLQTWNGSSWDDVTSWSIAATSTTPTLTPALAITVDQLDRYRMNVTQIGGGANTDVDVTVALKVLAPERALTTVLFP